MKRRVALLLPIAILAGCSQAPESAGDVREEAPVAGPDAGVTAAPGIALVYEYLVRLPAVRIAAVQERHAAACERLGPDRCRITGLHYRVDDRRRIDATLDLALAPPIARAFGRAAIAAVVADRGALVQTDITSRDAGAAAKGAAERRADAEARLAEIARLRADPRTGTAERATLTAEAAELRARIDAASGSAAEARAALAATPMHIAYQAGDLVPGFDRTAPLGDALGSATDSFVGALAVLVTVLATLAPWAVVLLLGVVLWRRYGHRLFGRHRPDD